MNELTTIKQEITAKVQTPWIEQSGLDQHEFDKEVSFAIQHFQKTPYLLKCTKDSIMKAVMNVAQTGLTLNPLQKFAYLVPRRVGDNLECCLDPSYMGLVKLLTDTGSVTSVSAQIIYENDLIEADLGSDEKILKHVPYFLLGKEKGSILGAYSKAKLHDGSTMAEMMSYKDLMEIRDRSEAYKAYKGGKVKSCIWVSDEGEMCRKTVIKRHWKYLPKSDKTEMFEKAIDLDNYANGYESLVDFSTLSILESKIKSSDLTEEKKGELMREIPLIETQSQAMKMMNLLNQHQTLPGRDRNPMNIKEQLEAVDYHVGKDDFYERTVK